MNEMIKDQEKLSRRDFLQNGVKKFSALALGGLVMSNVAEAGPGCNSKYGNPAEQKRVEAECRGIDPNLVGKNIIFSPEWLEYMPSEAIARCRDKMDIVCDAYVELLGFSKVNESKTKTAKLLVDIQPKGSFERPTIAAHAHSSPVPQICYNKDNNLFERRVIPGMIKYDSWDVVLMEEIAHNISSRGRPIAEIETMARLMMSYVFENVKGAKPGQPEGKGIFKPFPSGTAFRKDILDDVEKKFRDKKLRGWHR